MLLGYLGPDQLMPLASILAAVVGFALLVGRRVFGAVQRMIRRDSQEQNGELPPVVDAIHDDEGR